MRNIVRILTKIKKGLLFRQQEKFGVNEMID